MNISNIKRMQEEQEKSLKRCRDKITQWEKVKNEYEVLHEKIKNLSDRVTHDVMVPFGTLALVPGKLVHTNEVTVLLGDNWFAERSSKQACDIIERRLKQCGKMLSNLHEEEENCKNWIGFTQDAEHEVEDLVDIREEYDPEQERIWKEKHQENLRQYYQQQREERNKEIENTKESSEKSHLSVAIFPQENVTSTASTSSAGGFGNNEMSAFYNLRSRRVSWQDQPSCKDSDSNEGEDSVDDEEEATTLVIKFEHTKKTNLDTGQEINDSVSGSDIITSPADIYVKFGHLFQKTPKSILKKTSPLKETQPSLKLPPTDLTRDHEIVQNPLIVEKSSQSMAILQNVIERKPSERPTSLPTDRPPSRFKTQRLRISENEV